jgi:hypothetical protein
VPTADDFPIALLAASTPDFGPADPNVELTSIDCNPDGAVGVAAAVGCPSRPLESCRRGDRGLFTVDVEQSYESQPLYAALRWSWTGPAGSAAAASDDALDLCVYSRIGDHVGLVADVPIAAPSSEWRELRVTTRATTRDRIRLRLASVDVLGLPDARTARVRYVGAATGITVQLGGRDGICWSSDFTADLWAIDGARLLAETR